MAGYGRDFSWGTMAQSNPPSAAPYMSYTDNPLRPNLRYWFSPILMVDYLQNYNMDNNVNNYFPMQPGDSYEAPIYTAKEAYVATINTVQTNHPNDWVTVVPYSWPRSSWSDTNGRFNSVVARWGRTTTTRHPPSCIPSRPSMPTDPQTIPALPTFVWARNTVRMTTDRWKNPRKSRL